jgi:hypothetical protein
LSIFHKIFGHLNFFFWSVMSSPHFSIFNWIICSLMFLSILIILDISPLSYEWLSYIFSHSVDFLIIQLCPMLCKKILVWNNQFVYSFFCLGISQKSLPIPFFLYFQSFRLTIKCLIYFYLIFIWDRSEFLIFCIWVFSFPSTIFEEVIFFQCVFL